MAEVGNSTLMRVDAGIQKKDACFVIVKTEWNAAVVDKLYDGCIATLQQHNTASIRLPYRALLKFRLLLKRTGKQKNMMTTAHALL